MRAKRSKKYRKLMHQYELAFGFREPYQVLVDSNLLHAVHNFKMELIPALERTLQGKVKPLLTKCSLAAIMANQPLHPRTNNPLRPVHLPPPTILPLRHCSHNPDNTPIDETECLLSLLSPSTDTKRNKEHYTLATADPPAPKGASAPAPAGRKRKRGEAEIEAEKALRRAKTLRAGARAIPGVPIVYVKRSVMILEPMSTLSEGLREGYEMGKFRAGLNDERKKDTTASATGAGADGEAKKKKKAKGPKEPNPLSVKKPKKKAEPGPAAAGKKRREEAAAEETQEGDDAAPKPKRRRRHNRAGKGEGGGEGEGEGEGPAGDESD